MIQERKTRIYRLENKAIEGDKDVQLKLAKRFYYGKGVLRSLPLARYWAFMSVEASNAKSLHFYDLVNAPHFTGNERYLSIGRKSNFVLMNGFISSNKFRGKYDVCKDSPSIYRTYLVFRLFCFYFIWGAYRVYETQAGSYHVIGSERKSIKEYWKWLAIDVAVIAFFIILALMG